MKKKGGVGKRRRRVANSKQYQGGGSERGRKWQEHKIKREKEEKGWDVGKDGGKEMERKGDKSGEREQERRRNMDVVSRENK